MFSVHYKSDVSAAVASGVMRDGKPLEAVIWEKSNKAEAGDCALYKPRAPFCDACVPPNVCVADNDCRTPPATYEVGQVTLTGLNSSTSPLELTAIKSTSISYQSTETLPLPPCTPGGAVHLAATGQGDFPAFGIDAQCIAPLVVTTPTIAIESGKPFTLTWTPGAVAGARMQLDFDLSHHGGSKGRLICDTADTGSLEISAAQMKSLMDLGVTGFPWLTVTRILTGTTPVGAGTAELRLYSDLLLDIQVPGLLSCNSDADCPSPMTCLSPSTMCGIACTSDADCPTGQTCPTTTKICK